MILDINGQSVSENEQPDELGCEIAWTMCHCTIEKDDLVYKLRLHFGTTTYETRVPYHELTDEVKRKVYQDMLVNAFSSHDLGKQNKGAIATLVQS
jgi:hypothetical protein